VLWHIAVHALAILSVSVCGIGWPLKLVAAAALLCHAALRWPRAPTPLYRHADGAWSLPILGLERLRLCPGTAVGPFWARLALGTNGATAAATIVLLADQVDPEDWRRLQAILRRRAETGTV
jgi:hypothetical protein